MAVVNRTFSILCLRLGIKEIFYPSYTSLCVPL